MQKNVGTMDAIIRITCGLAGLAWATSRMVRYPRRNMPMLAAMVCAMRVAEGITRFCPMWKWLGTNTLDKGFANGKSNHVSPHHTTGPER